MKITGEEPVYPQQTNADLMWADNSTHSDPKLFPKCEGGIRLRTHLAGLALQAILSNETLRVATMNDSHLYQTNRFNAPAEEAVRQADALIKALNKQTDEKNPD